jgi:UDP:flavonoid glycosyltransferase YjiC (YdhE family)
MKDIRLKDLPSSIQTTEPNDKAFNFCMEAAESSSKALGIILHTFDALEQDLLNALTSICPSVYFIGPLQLLLNHLSKKDESESIGNNLWKEESECLKWLDSKEPGSVIYVNFGSIVSLTQEQLEELGWGLVNSHRNFLWIIRPDLVMGDESDSEYLLPELAAGINERGLIVAWCPQEEVLKHRSVGGFMTHCGWNSTIESLSAGVPMICWPFFADQQMNCKYACTEWEVGLEIGRDVKRDEVEKVVRELMGGEKGKKMTSKAMEWRELAEKATGLDGSSTENLNNLVNKLLTSMGG